MKILLVDNQADLLETLADIISTEEGLAQHILKATSGNAAINV